MMRRTIIGFMMLSLIGIGLASWSAPMAAQTGFVTNTPDGETPIIPAATSAPDETGRTGSAGTFFATNTPAPNLAVPTTINEPETTPAETNNAQSASSELVTIAAPSAPLDNYALRIWLEADLLQLVRQQIALVDAASSEAQLALQLTLYELAQRYPQAPTNSATRQQIILDMLSAPRGTIDMRGFVRPFIEAALNADPTATSLEVAGFDVTLTPAQIDNRNNDLGQDAVVNIRFNDAERGLLYDDYLIAVRRADGGYTFLNTTYGLTAAPFGEVEAILLRRVEDVNRDGLAEMVLRVDDAQVNDRLLIVGFRNDEAQNLVEPLSDIRLGSILSWPLDDLAQLPPLTVQNLAVISDEPDWPCLGAQQITWTYELNFYRAGAPAGEPQRIESLGCTLLEAEPLFGIEVVQAIDTLERALLTYTLDAPGSERALLYLAMLYVISGRVDDARNTAQQVGNTTQSTWARQQANALLQALDSEAGISSLAVCEALNRGAQAPACDTNAVLGRFLARLTLRTDTDLVLQLEGAGLPIGEVVTVSEIGRADRQSVSFNILGTTFWAFSPQADGTYLPEIVPPPPGFAPADEPSGFLEVPEAALEALFFDDDPLRALDIIENLERNNPDQVLSPAAQYAKALAYDLTGNRDAARQTYYDTWSRFVGTIFANLSAEHLSLRQ